MGATRIPQKPKNLVGAFDTGISSGRDAERAEILILIRREALEHEGSELGAALDKIADRISEYEHTALSMGEIKE